MSCFIWLWSGSYCGVTVGAVSGLGLLGISLAFGLAVVAMAYVIGPIFGCHINLAISVGMLVAGKLSVKDTAGYVVSQCLGAILGAFVLYLLLRCKDAFVAGDLAYGSNCWGDGYLGNFSMKSAFIAEIVFTAIFLVVTHAVTTKLGNATMAGLSIGITLALIHMVVIPITGTSVNPLRSIGPAVFAQGIALPQLWLFIVAPVLGGKLGTILWKSVKATEES